MNKLIPMLFVFLISCSGKNEKIPNAQKKESPSFDTSKYVLRLKIDADTYRNHNYEFRAYEAQEHIPAADFNQSKKFIFFDFPDLKCGNENLVAIDSTENTLCVNQAFFSGLVAVDVTRMGEPHTVGRLKPELVRKMNYKQILMFLLKAEIIQTYVHLYADVYLMKEEEYGDNYEARFNAVHHYCTNECIDAPYSFGVVINKKTGLIGLKP
jgi:hypothetical protein